MTGDEDAPETPACCSCHVAALADSATSVIRLRTQLAHAVFADDVFGRNAEPFGDERVQFRLRHRTRTVFVTAGFHHARTGGQIETQIFLRQIIQQMDEGKCRAEQKQWRRGAVREARVESVASTASKSNVQEPSAAISPRNSGRSERRFAAQALAPPIFCRTVSNMWTSDECGACAGGGVRNDQSKSQLRESDAQIVRKS